MGVVDLPEPRVGPGPRLAPRPIRYVFDWGRRYALWVFDFGLACCAVEFVAATMSRPDLFRPEATAPAPGPDHADVMVVSGTVTDKMAPAVRRLYDRMPEPRYVVSFGACANCGGPYWDSYCVTKGVDQIVPVDVYVPGCPPRPEALLHGLLRLHDKITAEASGDPGPAGSDDTPSGASPPGTSPPAAAPRGFRPSPPPTPDSPDSSDSGAGT